MKRELRLDTWAVRGGKAAADPMRPGYLHIRSVDSPVYLTAEGAPGRPDGGDFAGYRYFVIDLINHTMAREKLSAYFYEADGRNLEMQLSLFPGVRARAVFRLDLLDSSLLFPPLTPGTLKCVVRGDRVEVGSLTRVELGFWGHLLPERDVEIMGAWLSDALPAFPAAEVRNVDPFGQWIQKEFPGKIHSEEELRTMLEAEETRYDGAFPPGCSRFGGDLSMRFAGTGYFRVEKAGDTWYLVDPDGYAFFSCGVFGVYPGEPGWIRGVEDRFAWIPSHEGDYAPAFERAGDLELYRRKFSGMFPDDTLLFAPATANLIRAFGEDWYDRWARLTAARLRSWGVNTLSMFSDPEFIRRSGMPYVIMLQGYPVTDRTVFRDFPDVFSEEYRQKSEAYASQLASCADDPLMIGYFLNNEPTWAFVPNIVLAEKLLETGEGMASLDALIDWLRGRYDGDIARFNAAWDTDLSSFADLHTPISRASERTEAAHEDLCLFTGIMVDMYAGIPAACTRKVAPRHLCLGMRFSHLNNESLLRTAKHFDVFSFNCYAADPRRSLAALDGRIDMPMLVGEFHFGAMDAGLPDPSLFHVRDQAARGEAYMRYVQHMAAHRCGIGAHYFAYNDQPLWGRYDGENYQFGLVDICNRPYGTFTDAMRETHLSVCAVKRGEAKPLPGETERMQESR